MVTVAQETFLEHGMGDIKGQWRYYLSLLDIKANQDIIDVGCYTGDCEAFIAGEYPGIHKIVGIERHKDFYNEAVSKWEAKGYPGKIGFRLAHAENLPFPDNSFDRALCVDTLEWSKDPVKAINEMERVLKPGGVALIIHTDFDTQVFKAGDRELSRKIVHRFSDAGPNGQMGRDLFGLCKSSAFSTVEPDVYTLINTEFTSNSYAYRMVQMMIEWLKDQELVSEEEFGEWLADIEKQAETGDFFYFVNRCICRCVK